VPDAVGPGDGLTRDGVVGVVRGDLQPHLGDQPRVDAGALGPLLDLLGRLVHALLLKRVFGQAGQGLGPGALILALLGLATLGSQPGVVLLAVLRAHPEALAAMDPALAYLAVRM
jgi:hypothetical protein